MRRGIFLAVGLALVVACGSFSAEETKPEALDGGPEGGANPTDAAVEPEPLPVDPGPEQDAGEPKLLPRCQSLVEAGIAGTEDGFERESPAGPELTMKTTGAGKISTSNGGSPTAYCPTYSLEAATIAASIAVLSRTVTINGPRITWSFALHLKEGTGTTAATTVDVARLSFADSATLTLRFAAGKLDLVLATEGKEKETHFVGTIVTSGAVVPWVQFRADLALGTKPRVTVRYGSGATPNLVLFNAPLGATLTKPSAQDLGVLGPTVGALEAHYDWNLIYPTP